MISTRQKNKYVNRVVCQIKHGRVSPGDSDMWDGVVMKVPAVPPTNLAGYCNVIKVNYTLQLSVIPSGPAFDLIVKLPITIGTVPLQVVCMTFQRKLNLNMIEISLFGLR